jgi:thioredoxin reductase/NAD-dependent dihydropyrimidine dehydrogenase PreA subunit
MTAHPEASSDVRRPRQLALAALAAGVAVVLAVLVVPSGHLAAPGPLGRPHVLAAVPCAGCHGDRADAPATGQGCVTCHGAHPSTRPAHKALAARGSLGCPACHTAHGGAEGVTFAADGAAVRWRGVAETRVSVEGPPGATVAVVPLTACARCHDATRDGDPIQACIASGRASSIDSCFDEHQLPAQPLTSPLRPGAKCAQQHGPARFVAWEAARRVVDEGPAPVAAPARAPWLWVGSGLGAGGLAFAGTALGRRWRRRRTATASKAVPVAPAVVRLPLIDAARCLGCHACVDVCPFDVLSVEKHVAVVVRPDECCGVAACEQACPNGSLRLAPEGEPLADRPRVDAHLESLDRPGVFLAGDLTGVPLIRNAIAQGTRVVERVATQSRGAADGSRVDLVVVGAGPAGLAAALRAKELGLTCVVLEQSTVAATIRAFPRGKIVHDPPIELPLEGGLWLRESTKEELVAQWTRIVRAHRLEVREQYKVTGVAGEPGNLVVTAETPDGVRTLRAGRVLLAIGRRGTPRMLDAAIAPAAATRVVYALSDARALAGKHVLVVGLGDSAMEAVVALARQPGTAVTVSYRGAGFTRGRARNVDEVRRLAASGRVKLVFESTVERVDDGWVHLGTSGPAKPVGDGRSPALPEPGRDLRVRADAVLALLGGEPSRALLEAAGVRLEGT